MDCLRIKFRSVIKILSTYFYFFEMMEAFRGTKVFNHSKLFMKKPLWFLWTQFLSFVTMEEFFPPKLSLTFEHK